MFDCLCLLCFVDLADGEEPVLFPLVSALFICLLDVAVDAVVA